MLCAEERAQSVGDVVCWDAMEEDGRSLLRAAMGEEVFVFGALVLRERIGRRD